MKKLILIVIVGAAIWYGIQWFLGQAKEKAGQAHQHINPGEKALQENQ